MEVQGELDNADRIHLHRSHQHSGCLLHTAVHQCRAAIRHHGTLDTLGDRLMTWLQYRNIGGTESLWASRTVVAGTVDRPPLDGSPQHVYVHPVVYQQGTYAPADGKISLDAQPGGRQGWKYGDRIQRVDARIVPGHWLCRTAVPDTLGTLGQTEDDPDSGTGSQTGGYSRWGDYSSMSVDPVDDCTFWYTTEYMATTGTNWQTRIGSFKLPNCQ